MASELAEQLQSEISSLDWELSRLRSGALLSDLKDEVEDISSQIAQLPLSIEKIRSRGYAFKSDLERRAEILKEQWQELLPRVQGEIDRQSRLLSSALANAEREVRLLKAEFQRSPASAQARLETCKATVEGLGDKVQAASGSIEGMFNTLQGDLRQILGEIEAITWMLDQLDEACFGLRPGEVPIEATKATYLTEGDKGPKGILYLTDQRLLFERKEDVVTKKVLFIPTQKKRVQELLLDVPIGKVEESKGEERGFILRKEILRVKFSSGAPVPEASFRLAEDSATWRVLIGKVLSGEMDRERVGVEEKPAEPAREIPSRCPACGAQLTQEIVRGMTSITCEYCGTVIRIA